MILRSPSFGDTLKTEEQIMSFAIFSSKAKHDRHVSGLTADAKARLAHWSDFPMGLTLHNSLASDQIRPHNYAIYV